MSTSVVGSSVNVRSMLLFVISTPAIHPMLCAWTCFGDLERTQRIWTDKRETLVLALFSDTKPKSFNAGSYKVSKDTAEHIVCTAPINPKMRANYSRQVFSGPLLLRFSKHDPDQTIEEVAVLRPLPNDLHGDPYEVLMFGRIGGRLVTDGRPFKLAVRNGVYAVVTA